MNYRRQFGFTLVELMITVAIIALLASIALPSYRNHVIRGKRSAAQAEMMDIASREQQFLLSNRVYANKLALVTSGYVLPPAVSENYNWDVTIGVGAVPTFTITLTPTGGQASDGALSLDHLGNKTPLDKWKR